MLLLTFALALAPSPSQDALPRRHQRTQLAGMGVLSGYAVANIGWGVASRLRTDGVTRYVHEMNAAWNGINLTLGVVGLVRNRRPPAAEEALRVHHRTRTVFAINAGLDVLYIAAGSAMWSSAQTAGAQRDRVEGYGRSIVLQGAFLFAFDLAMLLAHDRALEGRSVRPALGLRSVGVSGRF